MIANLLTTASVGATVAFILAARWILQITYRRFFHPLRAVPGPWINSVSELPAALELVRGNQHTYYRSLHEKYGPVVRVSPAELSFISPEAREEIYGFRKGGHLMEKSPIFLGAVSSTDGQTGVSLALNVDHTRQRKALGYLFTNSALLRFEYLLCQQIDQFISILEEKTAQNESVDVSSWYTYLAFDIMGDVCFAEPFGCLGQASATEWSTSVINVFVAATWTQGIRRLSGTGTWLESLMTRFLVPARAAEWRRVHLSNSREKTVRRLADPDRNHPDFMYHILNSESKKLLSETEIVLNMALFISAGTDTTATALTGWTYFVCTHPEVYQRLIGEVRETLTSREDIRWDNVRHLRYLEATIYEALRLFPPSPASQQRIVPAGGATIDGYYVPAGMTVATPPWVATHSSRNFVDPNDFRPQRWMGEEDKFSGDKLNASLPFGTGPRVCIGKNLAYMEMRLISAHLLWSFDMALDVEKYKSSNEVWGLDGKLKPMKVFHSMTKPDLWVRLQKAPR
ncbi:cytochrome P450 monooxygenase [Colletotrichum tofieldiae]|uniref:Cytochrome P450 monooxygenase n=1 Tax=Colletotrichum tofieldiae TaxID=708197 RepID=A0A166MKI9_9PEZI|nr:cytochrome P450 monooxygenase [Colletotrichum tofieldiae]GKT63323.1 cytochrome P450 monooxygenase [Colletotrichum tofieldiae]GKT72667.1 cytochrome P450 monooxygenase [Colletotrichum tofieldiae]